ncbi:hypothetical protein [uncultured Rhodoblastus sp.]|uniref:hypothetical protein n=1 Tax=uncultured Rhodoblastus sp. TaxID=543037 RepID=UPI0025CE7CF9|nr:hypothetical protein [uncultured Rhodoblastus sp.]
MKFSQFEHRFLPHILLPLLGGLFVLAALQTAARSQPNPAAAPGAQNFVVSAADGYGVNDCIKSGDDCAKIVADAWCEAHGHGSARAFGPASDVTASIDKVSARTAPKRAIRDDDVFISCGE